MNVPVRKLPAAVDIAELLGLDNRGHGWNPLLFDHIIAAVVLNPSSSGGGGASDDETSVSFWHIINQNAVAATFNQVQLFNPAGSGRVLYVDEAIVTNMSAASLFSIRRHDVSISAGVAGTSVNLGSAGSTALVKNAQPAAGAGTLIYGCAVLANTSFRFPLRDVIAIRVEEGKGLMLECGTANQNTLMGFRWRELTS